MTKSEPGANSVEQLAEKQKNIGMTSSKKTFLLKINVFKTKRAYNKPPETAVFCYAEKIIKTKVLTANYSRQNDCEIIITGIIIYAPFRNSKKEKNNQIRNTKDYYPGFYTKTRRKINKKTV